METDQALEKAQIFLSQRLVTDLEAASDNVKALERQVKEYTALRNTLREGVGKEKTLADVGHGVALITELDENANPVINLGLAVCLEMEERQARAFITKKLGVLEKKKEVSLEKLAKIQALVHLVSLAQVDQAQRLKKQTSTSIAQLDKLARGGSILQDLHT